VKDVTRLSNATQFTTKVVRSTSHDPWFNLAVEELLLDNLEPGEVVFYLWQNQHTVVIGRNQNAWKECRVKELEEDGGKLARRLSGGGAVYQDLGNLCFTFALARQDYDLHRQLRVIVEGVKKLGIDAHFSGRNDVLADGRKFSGNAFYFHRDKAIHHGTVMFRVDFSALTEYLQVSEAKMKSKGVKSVRSRVINLTELNHDITIDALSKALIESFVEVYGGEGREYPLAESGDKLQRLYDKYSSWRWRFGKTPEFDVSFEARFEWGEVQLALQLVNGMVAESRLYSDAMDADLIEQLSVVFEGLPFRLTPMLEAIDRVPVESGQERVVEDLKAWLRTREI